MSESNSSKIRFDLNQVSKWDQQNKKDFEKKANPSNTSNYKKKSYQSKSSLFNNQGIMRDMHYILKIFILQCLKLYPCIFILIDVS